MPTTTEAELDTWLNCVGFDQFRTAVNEGYSELRRPGDHYPIRYLQPFAACVLSHHGGGPLAHSLPPNFAHSGPPLRTRAYRVGFYTVWYEPTPQPIDGFRWLPISPAPGFEVHWPKTHWIPRNGPHPDPAEQDTLWQMTQEIKRRVQRVLPPDLKGRVSMAALHLPGWRYMARDGLWYDLPVIVTDKARIHYWLTGSNRPVVAPLAYGGTETDLRVGELHQLATPLNSPRAVQPGQAKLGVVPYHPPDLPQPATVPIATWTPLVLPQFPRIPLWARNRWGGENRGLGGPYGHFGPQHR